MIRSLLSFLLLCSIVVQTHAASIGNAYANEASEAILMDYDTGAILFEKNADKLTNPSSMTKVMSVYLAFERLKDGRMTLQDKIPVSVKAWKTGGSRMFIEPNTYVSLEDLLRGIIIQSGNDASVALAEGLGGSEENFALEMTQKARDIGATQTTFKNSHGLAVEGHMTTVHDLAVIARNMIQNFPEFYPLFSERSFTYNNIRQPNKNPILGLSHLNGDGLKTGHTDEGGYGIIASATKGNRRLILVINGLPSEKKRAMAAEQLLSWGLREFENTTLVKAGDPLVDANTWLGKKPSIMLTTQEDVSLTLEKSQKRHIKMEAIYKTPIAAPIQKGQIVGRLEISIPGRKTMEVPLVSTQTVEPVGMLDRAFSALNYIIWGHG